jgi:hypothetical protein
MKKLVFFILIIILSSCKYNIKDDDHVVIEYRKEICLEDKSEALFDINHKNYSVVIDDKFQIHTSYLVNYLFLKKYNLRFKYAIKEEIHPFHSECYKLIMDTCVKRIYGEDIYNQVLEKSIYFDSIIQKNGDSYNGYYEWFSVDQNASFPGGIDSLMRFKYRYGLYDYRILMKDDYISKGCVEVLLLLNELGKIDDYQILRHDKPEYDSIAKKMINEMPNWIPAKKDGKNVKLITEIDFVWYE